MKIRINNSDYELPEQSVLTDALTVLNVPSRKGMALAVNSDVIPSQEWDSYQLKEEDRIIIIKATQGG